MKCVCSECACSADFLRPFMDRIQISKNEGTYITRWLCEECHHFYSFQKQLERWDAETKGDTPPPPSEPLPDQGQCDCHYPGAPDLEDGLCIVCGSPSRSGPLKPGAGGIPYEVCEVTADGKLREVEPPAKREGKK